ncbi:GT2 family glycosyltransferase [Aurantimicrobium minutum]|uniref:glycosyltransferase family 2 protein n=1 Tax=Aurantimicrobium minutum TaxID=708131 RepID=UPI002475409F|nr:glycosyltransferase [Aurantimicrobium minutum]MDH6533241.1 GT2 family glycosyltransferase [Aurantimicrobium minutum]
MFNNKPTVGVVVLTMGSRPEDLSRALHSVLAQQLVSLDVVVVGNGWKPEPLPAGVKGVYLPENLGIPAGRNAGIPAVTGEYLFFLDDDALIPDPLFLSHAVAKFVTNENVGLLQPRIADPLGGQTPRRWIPRLRKGEATHSSFVFSVLEAAVVMPRAVCDAIGGWGDPYFYAHEGIELAWRVWNTGKTVWYDGELVVQHPVTSPTRHAEYYRLNARNRVWLAKRNLPWILVPFYVLSWTGVQLVRSIRTGGTGLGSWLRGWGQGWAQNPGGRVGMSWKTVARMTSAGRFPIL